MYKKICQLFLFSVFAGIFFAGCNKESFIENEGAISDVGANPTNNMGSVTFWSSNVMVTTCSNGLRITIGGTYKGALTDYSTVSMGCGSNNTKTLTVTLPVGTHSYTANGTGAWCPKYTGTITVKKGVCIALELSK